MQTSNTGPESDDDEEEEAEDCRAYTEMESLEALRKDPAKLLQFMDDGRLDLLKFATATKTERPLHYVMMKEVFSDLLSEGVSESCFSTHAAFATDLRKTTDPRVIPAMVFCNRNHDLLFELIKDKIKPRYMAKFGRAL